MYAFSETAYYPCMFQFNMTNLSCFIIFQKAQGISTNKSEWNERTELCLLKVSMRKCFKLYE